MPTTPPPPTVSLSSGPAAASGSLTVLNGTSVTLRASASSALDGSGYEVTIQDQFGNIVAGPCTTGTKCSGSVSMTGSTKTYKAWVKSVSEGIGVHNSNQITVSWVGFTISLAVDTSTPPPPNYSFTLTATTNFPVDNTGYIIQILFSWGASSGQVAQCTTGSTCAKTLNFTDCITSVAYFTAYLDQGDPSSAVATSNQVPVNCP
jgi:hypothetical protein